LNHSALPLDPAGRISGVVRMLWTVEAIEILERLALEGRSASAIAAALGAPSRNAVIGKANRIGIKLGGGGRASVSEGKPVAPVGAQSPSVSRSDPVLAGLMPAPRRSHQRLAERGQTFLAEPEVGEMRKMKFDEIHNLVCRWPLGDPRSGEFAYCGLTTAGGQSYCAGHHRMAYQPPKLRPKQALRERRMAPAFATAWRQR
jgi:GcrA cell cycle regulator